MSWMSTLRAMQPQQPERSRFWKIKVGPDFMRNEDVLFLDYSLSAEEVHALLDSRGWTNSGREIRALQDDG